METLKFKTNIKCDACVAKVTPHLNQAFGAGNWEVDLSTPAKVLTVLVEATEAQVKEALTRAGYVANAYPGSLER